MPTKKPLDTIIMNDIKMVNTVQRQFMDAAGFEFKRIIEDHNPLAEILLAHGVTLADFIGEHPPVKHYAVWERRTRGTNNSTVIRVEFNTKWEVNMDMLYEAIWHTAKADVEAQYDAAGKL